MWYFFHNFTKTNGKLPWKNTLKSVADQAKLICPAHTLFTPWIPINTPSSGPCQDVLCLPYCLPHSYLKYPPLYSVVPWKYACKPSLVWSNRRHPSTAIVYPITRHKRRQLTTRVCHCKCICSCAAYEVQCCQLKGHKSIIKLTNMWR